MTTNTQRNRRKLFLTPENIQVGDQINLQSFDPAADGHTSVFEVVEILQGGHLMVKTHWCKRPRRAEWSQLHGGWYTEFHHPWSVPADGILRAPRTNRAYNLIDSPCLRFWHEQDRLRHAGLPYVDAYQYYHGG